MRGFGFQLPTAGQATLRRAFLHAGSSRLAGALVLGRSSSQTRQAVMLRRPSVGRALDIDGR